MDNFLEKQSLLKLTPRETESPNRSITIGEIEKVIKDLYKKALGPTGFTEEFYQTFKNQVTSILLKNKEKEKKTSDNLSINKNNNFNGLKNTHSFL